MGCFIAAEMHYGKIQTSLSMDSYKWLYLLTLSQLDKVKSFVVLFEKVIKSGYVKMNNDGPPASTDRPLGCLPKNKK
jgi:hypothetical protein